MRRPPRLSCGLHPFNREGWCFRFHYSDGPITYEKMTDDLAALIDHLQLDSVNVLGWSDGGIEALLLGIRYPTKVRKLVAMAANLNPSSKAIYPETEELVKAMLAGMTDSMKNTPQGKRDFKVTSTMLKEPHIAPEMLGQIKAPTLILGGDHDLITLEHLVEMFNHIPNAQLAIFPNSTHMVPFDDPAMFNATVDRFLSTPFVKRDRIADLMKSYEKLCRGAATSGRCARRRPSPPVTGSPRSTRTGPA